MDAVRLGPLGERVAARHLRRRGYHILARNYRAPGGEIDLVASDDGTLVFVEVKARSAIGYGTPQEAVDERKQSRIRRAANVYRAEYGVGYLPVRFDVVAIVGVGRFRRLELLKNAF
jgi:putative endonuclease